MVAGMARLVFVCWGNICRSPMAERVARRMVEEKGLDIEVESFGVSDEEAGNPIDRRAARTLIAAGYDAEGHRARRIGAAELEDVDLVVAAEQLHIDRLRRLAPDADNVVLMNDFNPALAKGTGLRDPWYGDEAGFQDTLADIEAAMEGILAEVQERAAQR